MKINKMKINNMKINNMKINKNKNLIILLIIVCIIIMSCIKPLLNYSETFKNNNNSNNNSKMYKIKKSKIHGNGIFATKFIKKDENIGLIFEDRKLSNGMIYTIIQPNFTLYVNHCEINDNTFLKNKKNKYYLHAKKNIPKGTELTTNYKNAPDTIHKNTKGFKKC